MENKMKIELKYTAGQEFTFTVDEEITAVEYREIDLSSVFVEPYRIKEIRRGAREFSVTTMKPAALAIIELRYGDEEAVFSSRDALERGGGNLLSIGMKYSGGVLKFRIEPPMEIDGGHLELRKGGLSIRFTGDISKNEYVFGKNASQDEIRCALCPDRYLSAILSRAIF